MKKILSVALSTAMAFSMFASVAFGADTAKLTPEQQFNVLKEAGIVTGYPDGLSHLERTITRAELAKVIVKSINLEPITGVATYKDKNYSASHWAAPFIEAATQAGIMQGKNLEKKLFDPTGNVTVQELAKVLVAALKLEVPTDANNSASEWAKGYVEAAIKAGYLEAGMNYQANATRSQVIVAAHAIYEANNFKVVKAEATDATHVKLTLSTGEVVDVVLEKALEANKETELTYKAADGRELKYKVTYVVTDATKVESVSASNLKQIVVAFDGEVDKNTAEDASNYTVSGSLNVESASLSADGKSVTLTLKGEKPGDVMTNQKEYKLSFNNVKSGSKVLSTSEFKFTPLDNAVPTATAVQALGNKTVKVTFSEPIYRTNPSSIKIDGKSAVGYTEVAGNVVILKLYSTLEDAEHTISISGVEDFVPFKSATQELKFSVVEDKEAPTVASVEKATFETVRIKFSEPVDKATVLGSNVYWLQGTSKKYAGTNVVQISDDTYEFDFSANRIQYATSLYLNGVKDYSGNTIAADTKVEVNPVVDQTRPEVVNAELNNDNKTFVVKFSKTLLTSSANDEAHYVVRDADGKEVRKSKNAVLQTDGKTVKVELVQALDLGKSYTLEVAGVQDTTILGNSSLPFSKKFDVANTSKATVTIDRISNDNKLVVNFSKAVALSGDGAATLLEKYYYSKDNGTSWNQIPGSTDVRVSPDSKAIILTFDKDDLKVDDIDVFRVQLVKDTDDQYINGLVQDISSFGTGEQPIVAATGAVYAVANNKIEVKFNKDLLAASVTASDFNVKAGSTNLPVIGAALKDGSTVVLTLADGYKLNTDGKYGTGTTTYAPEVTINANARTATAAGITIKEDSVAKAAGDKIAADLVNVTGNSTSVTLTFSEALKSSLDYNQVVTDLQLKKTDGSSVAFTVDSVNGNQVLLKITGSTNATVLQAQVLKDVRFLQDAAGNLVNGSDMVEFVVTQP